MRPRHPWDLAYDEDDDFEEDEEEDEDDEDDEDEDEGEVWQVGRYGAGPS